MSEYRWTVQFMGKLLVDCGTDKAAYGRVLVGFGINPETENVHHINFQIAKKIMDARKPGEFIVDYRVPVVGELYAAFDNFVTMWPTNFLPHTPRFIIRSTRWIDVEHGDLAFYSTDKDAEIAKLKAELRKMEVERDAARDRVKDLEYALCCEKTESGYKIKTLESEVRQYLDLYSRAQGSLKQQADKIRVLETTVEGFKATENSRITNLPQGAARHRASLLEQQRQGCRPVPSDS